MKDFGDMPVFVQILFYPIWMMIGIEMMLLLLLFGILFHRDKNGKINLDPVISS